MNVKCFGCDAVIAADDSDAVVDAFVAHGQKSHTWSYPEAAIRNYAHNYAEATERLTGGTERLSEIGDITVHPVTKGRIVLGLAGSAISTIASTWPSKPRRVLVA